METKTHEDEAATRIDRKNDLPDEDTASNSLGSSVHFTNSDDSFGSSHSSLERKKPTRRRSSKRRSKQLGALTNVDDKSDEELVDTVAMSNEKTALRKEFTKSKSEPRLNTRASKKQMESKKELKTIESEKAVRKGSKRASRKDLVKSRSEPRLSSSISRGKRSSAKKTLSSVSEHGFLHSLSSERTDIGFYWWNLSRSSFAADDKHLCLSPQRRLREKRNSSVNEFRTPQSMASKAGNKISRCLSDPVVTILWNSSHGGTMNESEAKSSSENHQTIGIVSDEPQPDPGDHTSFTALTSMSSTAGKDSEGGKELNSISVDGSIDELASMAENDLGQNTEATSNVCKRNDSISSDKARRVRAFSSRRNSDTSLDCTVYETVKSADESDFECDSEEDDSISHHGKPNQLSPIHGIPSISGCVQFDLKEMEPAAAVFQHHTKMVYEPGTNLQDDGQGKSDGYHVDGVKNHTDPYPDLDVDDTLDTACQIILDEHAEPNAHKTSVVPFGRRMSTVVEASSSQEGSNEFEKPTRSNTDYDEVVTFRNRHRLSKQEVGDIIAHLKQCQETDADVRWDLIHQMIHPRDNANAEAPQNCFISNMESDCRSLLTDGFDNESHASWFSIHADFDDCASSVTFMADGDDVQIGKRSTRSTKTVSSHDNSSPLHAHGEEGKQVSAMPCASLEPFEQGPTLDPSSADHPNENQSIASLDPLHAYMRNKGGDQDSQSFFSSSMRVLDDSAACLGYLKESFRDEKSSEEESD